MIDRADIVDLAERDYAAAEHNHSPAARRFIHHDATITLAGWASEAYLKAVLQEHGIASGKGHDLPALRDLLSSIDPAWADLREQARELARVADGAGYPGSKANKRTAGAVLVTCRAVRTRARTSLGLVP